MKICEIWGQAKLLEFQRVCLRTCPWGDPNGSDSSRITMQYTVKRRSWPLAMFANTMLHACIHGIRYYVVCIVDLSTTLSVCLHVITVYIHKASRAQGPHCAESPNSRLLSANIWDCAGKHEHQCHEAHCVCVCMSYVLYIIQIAWYRILMYFACISSAVRMNLLVFWHSQ